MDSRESQKESELNDFLNDNPGFKTLYIKIKEKVDSCEKYSDWFLTDKSHDYDFTYGGEKWIGHIDKFNSGEPYLGLSITLFAKGFWRNAIIKHISNRGYAFGIYYGSTNLCEEVPKVFYNRVRDMILKKHRMFQKEKKRIEKQKKIEQKMAEKKKKQEKVVVKTYNKWLQDQFESEKKINSVAKANKIAKSVNQKTKTGKSNIISNLDVFDSKIEQQDKQELQQKENKPKNPYSDLEI